MTTTDNLKSYIDKIDKYNNKELGEEYNKLNRLLSNIFQEYKDREDTIYLISRQIDEVRNRLQDYEAKAVN